ncbi:MAG: GAF domain-containing protein [Anaerolineae bacterium]|nr:GAF domain-containing protein [Anaerolineae bacterium]
MEDRQIDNKKQTGWPNGGATIGLFCQGLFNEYDIGLWAGVADVARERGVNLILFGGGILQDTHGFNKQANILYNLASAETVDGLVIWGAQLAQVIELEEMRGFLERYRPLPMVSIGLALEGIPCVVVDNYQGMHDVVTHLIEAHGCQRIAFLRKRGDNLEAQERYHGYSDALADHGLSFDPNLVVSEDEIGQMPRLQTSIIEPWADLMYLLLDGRKLAPQVDFDAVVGQDDMTALAALRILQARGVRVPEDVAVAGFDDIGQACCVTPSLTSAQQSFYQQGRWGTELLLEHLAGKKVPAQVAMPTKLIIRQSCGCLDPAVVRAAVEPGPAVNESLETMTGSQREEILSEMVQVIEAARKNQVSGWVEQLLDDFVATLAVKTDEELPGAFLSTLNRVLRQAVMVNDNIAAWQNVLSVLRRRLLPFLRDDEKLKRAADLWQQAGIMIGEATQRAQIYWRLQAEQQAQTLREIGQALITTFHITELVEVLAKGLPRLGIPGCYLALYENPAAPAEWSKLILAYNQNGRIALNATGQRFPSQQLAPKELFSHFQTQFGNEKTGQERVNQIEQPYSLVVVPLYFRENQLGFVLFEVGPQTGAIYEALRREISSALQGALFVEQRRQAEEVMAKRAAELELVAQVGAATSKILDTTALLERVADLIRDSFGLYHAHIYLLDEGEKRLVLAAGAGTVGQQMVAQGWSISSQQEQSLVARVARTRQGIIINDVLADPNWLPNPLLPDTRSELAVPLVAGERVLGVVDVQANEINHFTENDIRIQNTLAAQLVIALENARLFEQNQKNLALAESLYQAGRRITAAGDLHEIVAAVGEAVPKGKINRVVLGEFEYNPAQKVERLIVRANWHNGEGTPPMPVETRYPRAMYAGIEQFLTSEPLIFADIQHDKRFDMMMQKVFQRLNIRAMAVLPLWTGMRQIGVLLLLAEEGPLLFAEEIRPYISLMGQVAVAIENQRLLAETNAALAEIETTQRSYTVQAWEAYWARHGGAIAYEKTREGVTPTTAVSSPEVTPQRLNPSPVLPSNGQGELADGGGQENAVSKTQAGLVVPLTVREEVVGELGLLRNQQEWSPEERALVGAIAEQVAQAAENLRLIEETQQRGAREARINEISQKIQAAQSLEEALQIAVREVGLSLKTPQTVVNLNVSE